MMNVYLSPDSLSAAKKMLIGCHQGFPKAMSRALNKTVDGAATEMVGLIRSRYNIKATALRKRLKKSKSTYANLRASITSTGYGLHLTDVTGTRPTKKGVSVDVKKATGRKLITHAFIRPGRNSGKMIVFLRDRVSGTSVVGAGSGVRAGRYPISALYVSDPEILYNSKENWPDLSGEIQKRLDKNFDHEIDVVLKGYA
jgi:hypothetical protein